jgi:hypothetical protein
MFNRFQSKPPNGAAQTANLAPHRVWSVLGATGLAIGFAGVVQMANAWNPARFGNAYWVFRVTGGTVDGLALITASLIAVAALLIARGSQRWLKVLAVASLLLFVAAAAIFAGFLSSLGRVSQMAAAAGDQQSLQDSIVLTSVTAVASMAIFAYIMWLSWRSSRDGAPS